MSNSHPCPNCDAQDFSVHPSITNEQISQMVEQFYTKIYANELLGPIFAKQTTIEWELHLLKMKSFWRSVLLKTGEYKGKPVPIHQRLDGVTTQHFEEWLTLFCATSQNVYHPHAVPIVNEIAKRIATSLWLARNMDPFASPPDWQNLEKPITHHETA